MAGEVHCYLLVMNYNMLTVVALNYSSEIPCSCYGVHLQLPRSHRLGQTVHRYLLGTVTCCLSPPTIFL